MQPSINLEFTLTCLDYLAEKEEEKMLKNQYCEFFNPLSIVRQKMSMMFSRIANDSHL